MNEDRWSLVIVGAVATAALCSTVYWQRQAVASRHEAVAALEQALTLNRYSAGYRAEADSLRAELDGCKGLLIEGIGLMDRIQHGSHK